MSVTSVLHACILLTQVDKRKKKDSTKPPKKQKNVCFVCPLQANLWFRHWVVVLMLNDGLLQSLVLL